MEKHGYKICCVKGLYYMSASLLRRKNRDLYFIKL